MVINHVRNDAYLSIFQYKKKKEEKINLHEFAHCKRLPMNKTIAPNTFFIYFHEYSVQISLYFLLLPQRYKTQLFYDLRQGSQVRERTREMGQFAAGPRPQGTPNKGKKVVTKSFIQELYPRPR